MCLASISDLSPGTNAPTLSCTWKLLDSLDRAACYLSDGCWAGRGWRGIGGRDNHCFLVLGRMLRCPHCHPPPQCLLNGAIPLQSSCCPQPHARKLWLWKVRAQNELLRDGLRFWPLESTRPRHESDHNFVTPGRFPISFLICEVELIIVPSPEDCCDVKHSA